jgi:type I restriction enzyme S subunit
MKWIPARLRDVAQNQAAGASFSQSDEVWHLNLDQIEAGTGNIVNKKMGLASKAGDSTYAFDTSHVLYSKLRPYLNKVVCPNEPGIATTELVPLRPDPNILSRKFLTYYLRSPHFLGFASTAVSGVKMPRIIMSKFWDHEFLIPPLSEQERIVQILDWAEELRRTRMTGNMQFGRILPALFNKIFGNPANNPMKWQTTNLREVILDTQYGTSLKAFDTSSGGVPVIRMNNLEFNGFLDLRALKYVPISQDELEKLELKDGDILFNRTNSKELVGKTGIWRGGMKAVAASYLIRVRLNRGMVMPEYVWAYLNTPYMKSILFSKARRAIGMANINAEELKALPLVLPRMAEQEVFAGWIAAVTGLRKDLQGCAAKLESLYSVLMHRAFSGELTAKWRAARMEQLMQEMEQQRTLLGTPKETHAC